MSDTPSDGLAGMPAGPELSARLAVIDPHDVPDEQLPELLSAQWRQLAYQQAQTWKVMAEIAGRDPFPNLPGGARWTAGEVFENAVDEIRAELVLTRRSAGMELVHAASVVALPPVLHALESGTIDRARAIRFADGCVDLTGEQTDALLEELLPQAGQRTATELADQIAKVAIALDPAWAEHRYRQAIKERRVIGYLNADGSAVVTGQNLPADDAALACARIDALADAAKRAGAKAKIDHLRAEVFTGLLNGRFHGQSQQAIIADLLRQFPKQPTQIEEPAPAPVAEPEPAPEPAPAPRVDPEPERAPTPNPSDSEDPGRDTGPATPAANDSAEASVPAVSAMTEPDRVSPTPSEPTGSGTFAGVARHLPWLLEPESLPDPDSPPDEIAEAIAVAFDLDPSPI